jgi:hypothetical protein
LNFDLLNTVNIVLLPKKEGAEKLGDYRPISLIHSVAKLLAKILALQLAPAMQQIISKSQSAFIRGHNIHDNFMYVCNMVRQFHKNKTPMLLVKLDISMAFDLVRWDYILSLLQHMGFPDRWRNWLAASFSTTSSQVLLNGIPGSPITHGRGLRQGDPLSPHLFILAIDHLERLLSLATEASLLTRVARNRAKLRVSLYAYNVVIFLRPVKQEVQAFVPIIESLRASYWATNERSQVFGCPNPLRRHRS